MNRREILKKLDELLSKSQFSGTNAGKTAAAKGRKLNKPAHKKNKGMKKK